MNCTFDTYRRIHKALEYIYSGEIDLICSGRHELEDGIFVNVSEYDTKSEGLFEAHRKFIDIHYLISGEEDIEIASASEMVIIQEYDEDKEAILGKASGYRIRLHEKQFCVVMPEEAHLPGLQIGEAKVVRKAVIKVRI